MTQDEIIEMAIGIELKYRKNNNEIYTPDCDGIHIDELRLFSELVAQHEREACIVDIQMCIPRSGHDTPEMFFAKKVMERIRARGQA